MVGGAPVGRKGLALVKAGVSLALMTVFLLRYMNEYYHLEENLQTVGIKVRHPLEQERKDHQELDESILMFLLKF